MSLKVGVIGLNHGAQLHIGAFRSDPRFEVTAVCARTPGKAEHIATEYGVPSWFTDARDLLRSDVDVISIATPPRTHAGLAAAAMAEDTHVLVEIGFGTCADDARVLTELARERQRVAATAFVLRYAPNLRLVADLLAQNVIGRPRLMRSEFFSSFLATGQPPRWMWDSQNGGGVLNSFVSHAFDLARRWFGSVAEVDATLATLSDIPPLPNNIPPADDTGVVTLQFDSGLLATFTHCGVSAYPRTDIEIHGSEGTLMITGLGDEISLLRMGESVAEVQLPPEEYLEQTRGRTGMEGGFNVLVRLLGDAINDPAAAGDLPTFADGWEVARLVDAARLASRERRRVKLSEIG